MGAGKGHREILAGSRKPLQGAEWVEVALPRQLSVGGLSVNTFHFSRPCNGRSFLIPGQVLWPH